MSSTTNLGRVQPIYRGEWDSNTNYNRLENVVYMGNSYVSITDNNMGHTPPTENFNTDLYWRLVAQRGIIGPQGYTGSFGQPTATVQMHSAEDSSANVSIIATGPDTEKIFDFQFDLPRGPKGFDDLAAYASSLTAGTEPAVKVQLINPEPFSTTRSYASGDHVIHTETENTEQIDKIYRFIADHSAGSWNSDEVIQVGISKTSNSTVLDFELGIPAADGQGIKKIDGDVTADVYGSAYIYAVRYIEQPALRSQPTSQAIARANINAQISGNYPALPANTIPSDGTFLYRHNDGWNTRFINEVPTASSDDDTKFLRRVNGVTRWDIAYTVPASNAVGVPLIKKSSSPYDYGWGTVISSAEINELFD